MLASFSSIRVGDSDAHILIVPCSAAMTQSWLGRSLSLCLLTSLLPRDCHVSLIKMAFQIPGCSKWCSFLHLLTTAMPGPKQDLWAQREGELGFYFFVLKLPAWLRDDGQPFWWEPLLHRAPSLWAIGVKLPLSPPPGDKSHGFVVFWWFASAKFPTNTFCFFSNIIRTIWK